MQLARIVGLGLLVATLSAIAAPPQRQAIFPGRIAAPSTAIDCSLSPFGKSAPVIDDLEPMLLLSGPNGSYFDEYDGNQAPPFPRVFRANLFQVPLPGLPPLKSVSADLNGDGKDEVVVAYSDGNYVRLAVYERVLAPTPTALLVDYWTYVEGVLPDTIDLVAGDFVGGKDKKKQLAVSWKVAATGAIHVMILQGDASGHIGPADGFANGKWIGQVGVTFPHLAVGDFLLAGRDQLILAGYLQSGGSIQLDLIDYNHAFFFVLPTVGEASTRSAHFSDGLNVGFNTPFYAIDDAAPIAMQGSSPGGGVLDDMRVNGGDIVDTAAAELVVHVMFPEPTTPVSRVLAQRVLHFTTTRDASNNITAIALGDPSIVTHNFDSSIKLERYNGDPSFPTAGPRFAATIADVDAANKREIITARAGHDGTSGVFGGSLVWFAHQVHVRVVPSYQYKNQGSTSSGSPLIKFINNSRGDIRSYSWDFGDGTTGPDKDPQHAFPLSSHTYTVKLTATLFDNTQVVYTDGVTTTGGTDANPQGAAPPAWTYKIDPLALFKGNADPDFAYYTSPGGDKTVLKLAVGDTNRDGLPELVVAVSDGTAGVVDTHVFTRQVDPPGDMDGSQNFVRTSSTEVLSGNLNMELLMSDFDGDGVTAELNSGAGECRQVVDVTLRTLTWMPPYFNVLQGASSYRYTEVGLSRTTTNSNETTSESHFSEGFTVYEGFEVDPVVPVVAVPVGGFSIKASIGASFQQTTGESHADETGFTEDNGYDIGTDSNTAQAEGLLYAESDGSRCYTYTMVRSTGVIPASGARICTLTTPPLHSPSPNVALDWNSLITEIPHGGGAIHVPIHWIPAQRDWASVALFHVPTYGAATGSVTVLSPPAGEPPGTAQGVVRATDGNFDTAFETDTADRPYLDIDLGYVQDIQSVRVFPSANPPSKPGAFEPLDFKQAAPDLINLRLYASATPFTGKDLPTAATFTTFVAGGISTFVPETAIYRFWNVWTGDPFTANPLRARFLRLQKATAGKIRISEIQAFGGTHTEPQFYPEGVCDDRVGDGRFWANVFDTVNRVDKTIQVRGDMVWTGSVDQGTTDTKVSAWFKDKDTGVWNFLACVNDTKDSDSDPDSPKTVGQHPFWTEVAIGLGGSQMWNLQEDTSHTDSTIHSSDWDVHAGVELDLTGPGEAHPIGGVAVEGGGGVTTSHNNGTTMGTGFGVGAELAGFENKNGTADCRYFPRPYMFEVHEFSNAGYLQDMYVTDYIVRQSSAFADSLGVWTRDKLPSYCSDFDLIFKDDFGVSSP